MRVLITGAGGFVGAHLGRLVRAERPGWKVDAVARRSHGEVRADEAVHWHTVDLLDAAATASLLRQTRPEAIIHLAAQSSVGVSLAAPGPTLTGNLLAQLHLFDSCRAAGLDPLIVIAGSAEQYGDSARHHAPLTEMVPQRPVSPYAVSKVAQDALALQYHLSHGMRVVRLRLFNHIGPGQRPDFAIANFARQVALIEAARQPPLLRVGNLAARRDFTDVRDIASAYVAAVERARPGAVYNVGSGAARSVRALLDSLLALATRPITVEVDPARLRPADIPLLLSDSTPFRVATGWRPVIPIDLTLADILADWRSRIATAL